MKRILIANRGEIARRIIRSAHALKLETVAVYSEADADAPHVHEADRAVAIGPSPARDSYLNATRVLAAAREAGADAVHPGYGFLSENAGFAEAVRAAGLVWIGPEPATLRAMGDKQRARAIAEAAGVPVVPGSDRLPEAMEPAALARAAEAVGYPLLVKAAAGGGGIGMRRVDDPASLADAVRTTQSLAVRAFGDGTTFLERFVARARHVEVQVFGLGDGRAVHLFDRDCSLQRRFQKVVEEGPAPGLPDTVRARMAEAALALCRATRYKGAGTVEFIVDAESHAFYFLEMNTRIQVEHPVTEMITGTDLVAMQIDLARGTLGPLGQGMIAAQGHAVECRLYAENPRRAFMPSPGPLTRFVMPRPDADLRIESGYLEGDAITPYYDPMLAKLIARGPTRAAAIARLRMALDVVHVEGVVTNRDFLLACLGHTGFVSGRMYTRFIDEHLSDLVPPTEAGTAR
ncbi:MAG: acetyl-CoA carboxylase biotin carboxylase subunit [Rhodobacteraceae bacterium]|nr:acetyl-CoA carboxylase biotin carboxylase subunit [Paracoccaceae bacterium]